MRLKKKPKIIIVSTTILVTILLLGLVVYKTLDIHKEVKAIKIENSISKYGYNLKENKSKEYKNMFKELETILQAKDIDEKAYVEKISEMFIYDFYSLKDKTAKTDIGGTEFIHKDALDNFIKNAEDTYYKYLESNIYDNRKQDLPVVDKISINSTEQTQFSYGENIDEKAFKVNLSWTYTTDNFSNYQKEATLIFVHDDIKLSLVELK